VFGVRRERVAEADRSDWSLGVTGVLESYWTVDSPYQGVRQHDL